MNGYLMDTNAASILWDIRHQEHGTLRSYLQKKEQSLIWIAAQAIQYNLVLLTADYMRRLEEVSRILTYPLQLATWK